MRREAAGCGIERIGQTGIRERRRLVGRIEAGASLFFPGCRWSVPAEEKRPQQNRPR